MYEKDIYIYDIYISYVYNLISEHIVLYDIVSLSLLCIHPRQEAFAAPIHRMALAIAGPPLRPVAPQHAYRLLAFTPRPAPHCLAVSLS